MVLALLAVVSGYSAKRGVMSSVPERIRILTVDEHPLLREGIAALVNAESDMKLVAEACNGVEAIATIVS
jgi:hypothetical protein